MDYCQDLVEEERHPAFLPPSHDITKLFILDRHEKLGHRAAEMVVAALRQDVGILLIGGARTVRGYLADCFTCKLLRKTRAQQLMAPLLQYRVKPRHPVFRSISIDYTGPYEVKRARSLEKRWLCIFVCNLTSAVRVEVVDFLKTTAFLNALRRFLCITGNKTCHIRADCATTFIGARNKLNGDTTQMARRLEYSADVKSYLKRCSIIWEFSTPASSHHQGLVEQHIRTFKEVTGGVLGADNKKRSPSDFELMTFFREENT